MLSLRSIPAIDRGLMLVAAMLCGLWLNAVDVHAQGCSGDCPDPPPGSCIEPFPVEENQGAYAWVGGCCCDWVICWWIDRPTEAVCYNNDKNECVNPLRCAE
ncbi:MAG: hypothetical protein AB1635_16230 [Acidobacteriota bacterium]